MSAEVSDGLLYFLKYPLLLLVYVFLLLVVRSMIRSLPTPEDLEASPPSRASMPAVTTRPMPRRAPAPVPEARPPAPAPRLGRLEIVAGMESPPGGIPVDGPVTFGRSPECTVHLPDPFVSSRHARLTPGPEGPILEDLGSRDGTYLRQQRLEAPARLQDGDHFAIGDITFRYRDA